jgi:outer membrane usher protein FimD/PapC
MTFTVNQNLPDGWGGFYLSGRVADYWNRSGTEKQYQFSYNNMYGRLSWSVSAQRVYTRIVPATAATIACLSTLATRCGSVKTAPLT